MQDLNGGLRKCVGGIRAAILSEMLSLLPSTQLLLALWLLAAVAPAATALVNGSMMAFAVGENRVVVTARETGAQATQIATDKEDLSHDWLASDSTTEWLGQIQPDASPVALCVTSSGVALRDSSVAQTDLQRHRPKAAQA